jgi:hypothetical protein
MYAKYEKYIDTAVDGLIFDIEHNLKTSSPSVSLYEPVGLADLRLISLYDSRIGFIESKGLNVTRVSFSAPFQGYINLVDIKNSKPDLENRISKIETSLNSAIQQQKSFTTISQWKEMNNLEEQELQDVKQALDDLQTQVISLKEEVANL